MLNQLLVFSNFLITISSPNFSLKICSAFPIPSINPNLSDSDIDWFKNVVFLGNIKNLDLYFEDNEVSHLRMLILDEIYKNLSVDEQHLAVERFLGYENYFYDLMQKHEFPIDSMAHAIFEKYEINNYLESSEVTYKILLLYYL